MTVIQLDERHQLELVPVQPEMADEIFAVIDGDRAHIGEFLTFVALSKTVDFTREYLVRQKELAEPGKALAFVIRKERKIIGTIEFHRLNTIDHRAEMGYWLASDYTRQGIMTAAVKAMCAYGFATLDLHQINILADVDNAGSNAVIQKTGFQFLVTRPEYSYRNGRYHDMNEYYLLAK
ncbi:acetyltransferase [Fructobacillus pseudoficulneus]|uniref:Acetyltransferase n=1 Tax=Fructobacillus pseudoficulneus TaxID=220714 RepID=A0A3F3GVS1_9LACO|nr:GNAT family N-acetyltransferase [Fructobacillus pseudoficulneus]GAP03395.1 acetyltransferase [Fructobacillus pseudoficulneus]SEH46226.1 ribosomal-protein-serine acetyltransferase [Fructobacillus pseudoficulneus]